MHWIWPNFSSHSDSVLLCYPAASFGSPKYLIFSRWSIGTLFTILFIFSDISRITGQRFPTINSSFKAFCSISIFETLFVFPPFVLQCNYLLEFSCAIEKWKKEHDKNPILICIKIPCIYLRSHCHPVTQFSLFSKPLSALGNLHQGYLSAFL